MAKREQVEPTEDWAELEVRLEWPEQVNYELIRPPLLSGVSVAERSRQTGASESRLRRGITGFKSHGMRSLFEPEEVEQHSQLDPEVRRAYPEPEGRVPADEAQRDRHGLLRPLRH
jgi:hypothetical protein